MSNERCGNCRYHEAFQSGTPFAEDFGWCHRYPPVRCEQPVIQAISDQRQGESPWDIINGIEGWSHPVTETYGDWCGEWKPKETNDDS